MVMAELPFLVVHGEAVWKALLAALVVVSIASLALLRTLARTWWVRSSTRATVRALAGKVTAVAEGDIHVRGILRGGSLATLAGRDSTRDHVEATPRIECADGTRVELAGTAHVAVGARTATSRLLVPAGTPEAIADRCGRWILRTVRDGDEVIAIGNVTRHELEEVGHRDHHTPWRLTDGKVIALVPAAKPRPTHLLALCVGLAAAAAIATGTWYRVLRDIGTSALERMEHEPGRPIAREIDPYGDFAVAAAMPGSRDEAFRRTSDRFYWNYQHVGSVLPLRDAIDQAIGPCWGMDRNLHEVRFDVALASERTCRNPAFRAYVQLFRGYYQEALESPDQLLREYAAIGAGTWEAAAVAADVQSNAAEHPEVAAHARCRAAWYRNRAGVSVAIPTTGHPRCRIYAALALPRQARRAALEAIVRAEHEKPPSEKDRLVEILEATLPGQASARPFIEPREVDASSWLLVHHLDDDSRRRELINQLRASLAVLRGDFASARHELAKIADASRDTVALWIAEREGTDVPDVDPDLMRLHPAAIVRMGRHPPVDHSFPSTYPRDCDDDLRAALERAAAGDGGPLARVFAGCRVSYPVRGPELLFGVLPRVTQHRAELADALRVYRNDGDTYRASNWPFEFVQRAAEYRDLARLAGDDDEADRWQGIVIRHARVLGDRDRATAFALLDRSLDARAR
jgi:hypothetical protein